MPPDPLSLLRSVSTEQDDVILYAHARSLGVPRRLLDEIRLSGELPSPRGVLVVPPVRDAVRTSARAAQLAVRSSVVSHTAAARLHGLQGLPYARTDNCVELTVPRRATRHQRRGIRIHFSELDTPDVVSLGGLSVTSLTRTLRDCASVVDRMTYICLVDSALQQELLTATDFAELRNCLSRGRRRAAAEWLSLVDGRSESPSETRVRVTLADGGLPPDELQLTVYDDFGMPVARLDIAYRRRGRRVGIEVDSGEHERPRALYRDREKLNALVSFGWDVRRLTAWDAWRRPAYVLNQARDALGLR